METSNSHKKVKPYLDLFITAISLLVAYGLITYIDFGFYIVLGYIFYSIQSTRGWQLINADETNQQLKILYVKIREPSTKRSAR